MPKRRGPKPKGHGRESDFYRGYQTGWRRVENRAKGVTPRRSRKGKVEISKQSKQYREGYKAGFAAAKKYYGGK